MPPSGRLIGVTAAAVVLSISAGGAAAVPWPSIAGLTSSRNPDNRPLTPAGTLYPTAGAFPAGSAISSDGSHVFVIDASKILPMLETFSTTSPTPGVPSAPLSPVAPSPPGELPTVQSGQTFAAADGRLLTAGGQTGVVREFSETSPAVQLATYQVGAFNGLAAGDRSGYVGGVVELADGHTLIATEPFNPGRNNGRVVVRYDTTADPSQVPATLSGVTGGVVSGQSPGAVTAATFVGEHPYALAVSPAAAGRQIVAVANQDSSSVTIIDPAKMSATPGTAGTVVTLPSGRQPVALRFTPDGRQLLVVDNLDDDMVVFDTATWRRVERIDLSTGLGLGASPNSLALSADGRAAYVTLALDNAVAVIARRGNGWQFAGLIPTARYPTSVTVDDAHRQLFITDGKAGGATFGNAIPTNLGALEKIAIPNRGQLAVYTAQTQVNNTGTPPVCARSSLRGIKHVLYIIRENKTYDMDLGDMPGGSRRNLMYGQPITPNLHALLTRFPLLENFTDNEEESDTGHQAAMGAEANDWTQRMSEQSYDLGGAYRSGNYGDDVYWAPGDYLINDALKTGISFRDYGEFYETQQSGPDAGQPLAGLAPHIVPGDQYDTSVVSSTASDVTRVNYWINGDQRPNSPDKGAWGFQRDIERGTFPQLEVIYLPEDHTTTVADDPTIGVSAPATATQQQQVAQSDLALGQLMDALSHSKYWDSTAVFMTEDDPQDGSDHIDPHRSLAMVAGPVVRQGVKSLVPYDQYSILRTIEMILGMPPMTEHDANARPMLSLFSPTLGSDAPYTALAPTVSSPSAATLARVKALSEQYFHDDPAAVFDKDNAWKMRQLEWLSTHGTMWHPPTKAELAQDHADQTRFYAQAAAQAAGTDDCEMPTATRRVSEAGGTRGNADRSRRPKAPTPPGTPWPQFGNPSAVLSRRSS